MADQFNQTENKPSMGLNILSFLIPLVGLILFFVKKGAEPNSAKSYLTYAISGFVVGIIMSFLL